MKVNMRGLCECGCGQYTPIAKQTRSERGQIRGQPLRFITHHNLRKRFRLEEFSILPDSIWCSWFTGFVDAEGSFNIRIVKSKLQPKSFECILHIDLREDDKPILEVIQTRIGGRLVYDPSEHKIKKERRPHWKWSVSGKPNLARVVNLFDKYPLRTKKKADYLLWREVVLYQLRGRHHENGREYVERLKKKLDGGRKYKPLSLE